MLPDSFGFFFFTIPAHKAKQAGLYMIQVTRLNGKEYWINPHQIEAIECNPDVTLQMLSGKHIVVREKPDDIIDRIIAYRRRIGAFKNEE